MIQNHDYLGIWAVLHVEAVAGAVKNGLAADDRVFVVLIDLDAIELVSSSVFVGCKFVVGAVSFVVWF